MMQRGRKKPGRGYDREAWIKHHQQIVERVEKQNKLQKLQSTAEYANTVQSGQKSDGLNLPPKQVATEQQSANTVLFSVAITSTGRSQSTEEHNSTTQVFTQRSTSTNLGQNVQAEVSDESTIGKSPTTTGVHSTSTEDLGQSKIGQNVPKRSKEAEALDDDDIVMLDELPMAPNAPSGQDGKESNVDDTGYGRSDDVSDVTNHSLKKLNVNDAIDTLRKTSEGCTQAPLPVEIKQEILDEITGVQSSEVSSNDDRSMSINSASSNDWMDDEDTVVEDRSGTIQKHRSSIHKQGEATMVAYKRKSATAVEQNKQKRQQTLGYPPDTIEDKSTMWDTPNNDTTQSEVHSNDIEEESMGTDPIALFDDNKHRMADTATYSIAPPDGSVQTPKELSSTVTNTTTRDYTPTDSDNEWAAIATKINARSSIKQTKPSNNKIRSQSDENSTPKVRFSKKNTVMSNRIKTGTNKSMLQERGLHLTDDKAQLTTPVKI